MTQAPKDTPVMELFRLDGKVAWVAGAAGHLGPAISFALAEAGATVVLSGRNEERLRGLAEQLLRSGYTAEYIALDVTNDQMVDAAAKRIAERHDALHVLVNNAYSGSGGNLLSSASGEFLEAYDVAVAGAFRTIRAAYPLMVKAARQGGNPSIINIATMYAHVSPDPRIYPNPPMTNPPFYGAAKAGLVQLTRYAAVQLAPDGIRVNVISPGPFPRPEVRETAPEMYTSICARTPMGRVGQPEELKGAIVFLASNASTYVTGVNLAVDGGWTAW